MKQFIAALSLAAGAFAAWKLTHPDLLESQWAQDLREGRPVVFNHVSPEHALLAANIAARREVVSASLSWHSHGNSKAIPRSVTVNKPVRANALDFCMA